MKNNGDSDEEKLPFDASDNEEIDENCAFDDEDEKKWGHLFTGTSDISMSSGSDRDSDSAGDGIDGPSAFDDEDGLSEGYDIDENTDLTELVNYSYATRKTRDNHHVAAVVGFENRFANPFEKAPQLNMVDLLDAVPSKSLHAQIRKVDSESSLLKVQVPIEHYVKAKFDREAAYTASSESVSKWLPFVQKTRRSEYLQFPLNDRDNHGNLSISEMSKKMRSSGDMESEINDILASAELQTEQGIIAAEQQMLTRPLDPSAEKRQRVEMQKVRALLFHAEKQKKRQAKIKSKSYHRIRKSRIRTLDNDMSLDDSQGDYERKRAEERMSLRRQTCSRKSTDESVPYRDDNKNNESVDDVELSGVVTIGNGKSAKHDCGVIGMKFMNTCSNDVDNENSSNAGRIQFETAESLQLDHKPSPNKMSAVVSEGRNSIPPTHADSSADKEHTLNFENQKSFIEMAFIDDNVADEFLREKQAVAAEQGPRVVDSTLPGWGVWSNQKPQKKISKRIPGLKAEQRRDFKMKHVIINEKHDNKFIQTYQTSRPPYPYSSASTYDALNRTPLGKEWNATIAHEKLTRPRIKVKTGKVITPPQLK